MLEKHGRTEASGHGQGVHAGVTSDEQGSGVTPLGTRRGATAAPSLRAGSWCWEAAGRGPPPLRALRVSCQLTEELLGRAGQEPRSGEGFAQASELSKLP